MTAKSSERYFTHRFADGWYLYKAHEYGPQADCVGGPFKTEIEALKHVKD